uniref:Uncharacterized protein n=1 Tax=Setaria viridis TaxID=4556 RepID=A0A4U6VF85_SETVI|nr:hypothetical protein SEVIR_3G202500v2 [Setaria viridis]
MVIWRRARGSVAPAARTCTVHGRATAAAVGASPGGGPRGGGGGCTSRLHPCGDGRHTCRPRSRGGPRQHRGGRGGGGGKRGGKGGGYWMLGELLPPPPLVTIYFHRSPATSAGRLLPPPPPVTSCSRQSTAPAAAASPQLAPPPPVAAAIAMAPRMALGASPPSAGDGAYSSKLLDALRLVVRSGGRSRWSRAILAPLHQRTTSSSSRPGTSLLASKTRVLGRLVLGCRRLSSLPTLLAEVSDDYIAALQMQVRAMNQLTQGIEEVAGGVIIHIFKN